MRIKRILSAVDAHTAGMPMRVVTGGFPHIPGKTMLEKAKFTRNHLDDLRGLIVLEPRGHAGMFAALLTEPVTEGADAGAVFLNPGGYDSMCGHGTMAICTVMIETGQVEPGEPETRIRLDTPAGVVNCFAEVKDGVVGNVTIENVPSFLYASDIEVDVPGVGGVRIDVAYGGDLFYAILPAKSVGIKIDPTANDEIIKVGRKIWDAAQKSVDAQHPEIPELKGFAGVIFSGPPADPKATLSNATFGPPGFVDRSPCGTGTCAKMAELHAKGELAIGEEFVHESVIGTFFHGRAVKEVDVGPYAGILPTVAGQAYLTAFQRLVLDQGDPFPSGFHVGEESSVWGAE